MFKRPRKRVRSAGEAVHQGSSPKLHSEHCRSREDSSRIKAAVGFLSFPPPFKIRVNGSDLQLESRALMTPREGKCCLDVDVTEVVQEKENENAVEGLSLSAALSPSPLRRLTKPTPAFFGY